MTLGTKHKLSFTNKLHTDIKDALSPEKTEAMQQELKEIFIGVLKSDLQADLLLCAFMIAFLSYINLVSKTTGLGCPTTCCYQQLIGSKNICFL